MTYNEDSDNMGRGPASRGAQEGFAHEYHYGVNAEGKAEIPLRQDFRFNSLFTSSYKIIMTSTEIVTVKLQKLLANHKYLTEVNPDITEKIQRGRFATRGGRGQKSGPTTLPPNRFVRNYMQWTSNSSDLNSWMRKREIPMASEILSKESDTNTSGDSIGDAEAEDKLVEVPVNNISGPWRSKAEYLNTHYELLREDAIAPLRDAVADVREDPLMGDTQHVCIYERTYIVGITFSTQGIGARVSFSLARAAKRIKWDQSNRLRTGSIVALTPATDMFKTVCKVATVAARSLVTLEFNPPEIDLFFADPSEIEIDPQAEWIMVEARQGYYEAYRHSLTGLQRLMEDRLPLESHLINLNRDVSKLAQSESRGTLDMSSISSVLPPGDVGLPSPALDSQHTTGPDDLLDQSQLEALNRILNKELALIQGPPGTGKTHVSVVALKVLLSNFFPDDPPIIIAAETNHALDQLLRHVSKFESNFIRLGTRSKDKEIIKPRTLRELKQNPENQRFSSALHVSGHRKRNIIQKSMKEHLEPLSGQDKPFDIKMLHHFGVLSETQVANLKKGASDWIDVSTDSDEEDQARPMVAWLSDQLIMFRQKNQKANLDMDYEEIDPEQEQLQEFEAEVQQQIADEEEPEQLRGLYLTLKENYAGSPVLGGRSDHHIEMALRKENLWDVPQALRGSVYCLMQKKLKEGLREKFRTEAREYMQAVTELRTGRWEVDAEMLKKAKVIGMTITGLSKYRGLVASLKPKTILLEEAAETLEGQVLPACIDSLEHLILVGDHKQLSGHCTDPALAGEPFNLGISMFQRLVDNGVEYTMLRTQRRMHPEIREVLNPIYDNLQDHRSTLSRAPVPGMGAKRLFFYAHNFPESEDDHMSRCNVEEADMIVGFFDYLVLNGVDTKTITILTFYNGQRKLLLRKLRSHRNLEGRYFNVVTVDSYQGEENEIILLSLVRSNENCNIGFLSVANRVCVALSRARAAMYIFGNGFSLYAADPLWAKVLDILSTPDRRASNLPLYCSTHKVTTPIGKPQDFLTINGGCTKPCKGELPCGHLCALKCHPFSHEVVVCDQQCKNVLPCGHSCIERCWVKSCRCECGKQKGVKAPIPQTTPELSPQRTKSYEDSPSRRSELSERYHKFASGGVNESDAQLGTKAMQLATKLSEASKQYHEQQNDEMMIPFVPDEQPSQGQKGTESIAKVTATMKKLQPAEDGTPRNRYQETIPGNPIFVPDEKGPKQESLLDDDAPPGFIFPLASSGSISEITGLVTPEPEISGPMGADLTLLDLQENCKFHHGLGQPEVQHVPSADLEGDLIDL